MHALTAESLFEKLISSWRQQRKHTIYIIYTNTQKQNKHTHCKQKRQKNKFT